VDHALRIPPTARLPREHSAPESRNGELQIRGLPG
jgi:hypothetical protein